MSDKFQIVHYASNNREYVVIVSPGEEPEDQLLDGYSIMSAEEVDADLSSMPCDRILREV